MYQFCVIHTADTTDGKVHRIRESPSCIPAHWHCRTEVRTQGEYKRLTFSDSMDKGARVVTLSSVVKAAGSSAAIFLQKNHRNTLLYNMLTSFGKNLFGHNSSICASSMHNNCFLEGCYIIMNHLVQFFETIKQRQNGVSRRAGSGGFGKDCLLMTLFV